MTIDSPTNGFPLTGAIIALALWFGGMSSAAIVLQPGMVTIFGPQRTLIEAVASLGGDLVSAGSGRVTATTSNRNFVRELYARGAWLVWPSLGSGCLGRSASRPRA